jgi:hypothetical protein
VSGTWSGLISAPRAEPVVGRLRTFLAVPVGWGGALLVSAPLTAWLGVDPTAGAVTGALFGGWIAFVGSYVAPSPRWKPALFFVGADPLHRLVAHSRERR